MRRLRLTVLLAAATAVALVGCTDPSPDTSTAEPSASSQTSQEETTEPTTEASAGDATAPIFGTTTSPGGGGSVCPEESDPIQATLSTVLTATSPITLESVTLTPESPDVEILDQFVLPYDGGLGGLTFGDYPPDDREGERSDAADYQLDSGETITIGVGFSIAEAPADAEMTLGITYKYAGSGDSEELQSSYQLVLGEDCDPSS